MAFTFGASSKVNAQRGNPILLSHTTVANTKLLVVGIITKTTTARTGGVPTFNGVAMVQVGSTIIGKAECTSELWYLSNPSIGTYNVSVPNSGAATVTVIASSYVDASVNGATLDVYNSTNVTGANPALLITTTENGEAIVDVFGSGYFKVATANSHTLLYQTDEGVWTTYAQYALQASAGAITLSWTQSSDDVAFIVAGFKGVFFTKLYFDSCSGLTTHFHCPVCGEDNHSQRYLFNKDRGSGTMYYTISIHNDLATGEQCIGSGKTIKLQVDTNTIKRPDGLP